MTEPLPDRRELSEVEREEALVRAAKAQAAKAKAARRAPRSAPLRASLDAGSDSAPVQHGSAIPLDDDAGAARDATEQVADAALARALQEQEEKELSQRLLREMHESEHRKFELQQRRGFT